MCAAANQQKQSQDLACEAFLGCIEIIEGVKGEPEKSTVQYDRSNTIAQ